MEDSDLEQDQDGVHDFGLVVIYFFSKTSGIFNGKDNSTEYDFQSRNPNTTFITRTRMQEGLLMSMPTLEAARQAEESLFSRF
tara:strand:+ start:37751 stop:37999 length:249 start_codon:yes stop_codon:yes gene_type:complete